jgi:hypothetical protein
MPEVLTLARDGVCGYRFESDTGRRGYCFEVNPCPAFSYYSMRHWTNNLRGHGPPFGVGSNKTDRASPICCNALRPSYTNELTASEAEPAGHTLFMKSKHSTLHRCGKSYALAGERRPVLLRPQADMTGDFSINSAYGRVADNPGAIAPTLQKLRLRSQNSCRTGD